MGCLVCNRAFANDEELGEPLLLVPQIPAASLMSLCCLVCNRAFENDEVLGEPLHHESKPMRAFVMVLLC